MTETKLFTRHEIEYIWNRPFNERYYGKTPARKNIIIVPGVQKDLDCDLACIYVRTEKDKDFAIDPDELTSNRRGIKVYEHQYKYNI